MGVGVVFSIFELETSLIYLAIPKIARSTLQVPRQPGLLKETLSQNKNKINVHRHIVR